MAKNSYRGASLTVSFDGQRCIHARRCVLGLPGVFIANADGDWIQPDEADPEELAALIRQCPSGALSFTHHDGRQEKRPDKNVIRLSENGPLLVRADLSLDGTQDAPRRVLCRCGASKRKPYCDGSHAKVGFQATAEPETPERVGTLPPKAPLEITPMTNGPLIVRGPVEVVASSGRAFKRSNQLALCRCGASANKPYCDGSHTRVGFTSE